MLANPSGNSFFHDNETFRRLMQPQKIIIELWKNSAMME
jgi:hypothetical protein